MKQIITFLFATIITVTALGQKAKPEFKTGQGVSILKIDSLTYQTPLLTFADYFELQALLNEKDKIVEKGLKVEADSKVITEWVYARFLKRAQEFYEKQKIK